MFIKKDGTDLTLNENIEVSLHSSAIVRTVKRFVLKNYYKYLNDNEDLNKEIDSIVFIYTDLG